MTTEAKVLISIGLVSIAIVVGGALIVGNSNQQPEVSVSAKTLVSKNSNKEGSSSAKVTLVEFADFQCPACAAWFPAISKIRKDHAKDVLYVFRHFPLEVHKNAKAAAYAAEAAGAVGGQGKFWEMHDLLYVNQSEWSESDKASELFSSYAEELKLDKEKFIKEMNNAKISQKIQDDVADGFSAGVNSTPTFFLNGKRLDNLNGFEDLTTEIDTLLKK